ncbi:MAG: DedA family protein [Thermoguttaceae bacterium]|nr:DedA family protein [Thermoguttaceae bacterium]
MEEPIPVPEIEAVKPEPFWRAAVLSPVRGMRRLYDWVLSWSYSPFGPSVLALVSFAESSFFPIPPDPLQIALSIERPRRSFRYALISAVASVLGALLGWVIGHALWGWLEPYFVPNIISEAHMLKVRDFFDSWGFWALFAAAFTPLPFKAFTITGGMMAMPIPAFVVACFVGRSLRFFAVAALLFFFGPSVKGFIDKYFGILSVIFLVMLVGGFYLIKFIL